VGKSTDNTDDDWWKTSYEKPEENIASMTQDMTDNTLRVLQHC
jgi:hypothetical protein